MSCKIIDGSKIAAQIKSELFEEVKQFYDDYGYVPGLAAVIVGKNPASELYVSKKMQACGEVGIEPTTCYIPAEEDALIHQISVLNKRKTIHGFILQLPLPIGMDPNKFFGMIDPRKDVDVFNPENVGLLVQHRPRFKPCTPHGIQVLLYRSGIQIAEKRVVVINRSNVVGKPLSSMLIQECDDFGNATVTVCHDRTPPQLLKEICRESDIIVVAVGKPGFLTSDMVKPGAAVVDVGITRIGKKIFGDVDFEGVSKVASAITKVPGGVGPMTVAMLLKNTLQAAKMSLDLHK
jgi:methylenetetrahydrofolate dehydrogenase (NADP+)/methenyltetrahydrofolate cyclohydrolase